MRLQEFETITQRSLTPRGQPKEFHSTALSMIPKNAQHIGAGGSADVFASNKDPGTVVKIQRKVQDIKKDAYFHYLSMLAKSDRIQRNPYFPRVYGVKVRKLPDGRAMYSATIERLLPMTSLSVQELEMLGEKMFFGWLPFVKDALARLKEIEPKARAERLTKQDKQVLVFTLLRAMTMVVKYGAKVETYIKDPKLREALTLLKGLIKHSATLDEDLHIDNVMVRRGPGGPQLVLADPVAEYRESDGDQI